MGYATPAEYQQHYINQQQVIFNAKNGKWGPIKMAICSHGHISQLEVQVANYRGNVSTFKQVVAKTRRHIYV